MFKSNLYYPAEARNEWRGPSLRLSVWATQTEKKKTQRRRVVGDTVFDVAGLGTNLQPLAPIAMSSITAPVGQ